MRAVYSILKICDAPCARDKKDNAGRMRAYPDRRGASGLFSGDATRAKIRAYIEGVKTTMTPG
jgi:hypothetical protein